MEREIRPLQANEIEIRVGRVTQNGCSLLLYKNARADMAILDETYGREGWQRDHKEVKGNMFCGVGIKTETGEWIWKWDCGTESNTEKEKGESSDAFKRACTNIGIGRELYESPNINLKVKTKKKERGDGWELEDKFTMYGVYVKEFETAKRGSKRVVTKVVLHKKDFNGDDYKVWSWEDR